MKTGLDDYLCSHTTEDLKKLPVHEIVGLEVALDRATPAITPDDLKEIQRRIAKLPSASEMDRHINTLRDKTKITKLAIRRDIKDFAGTKEDCKSQAEMLIEIASGYKLFSDDVKEGYAYMDNVAVKIRSSQFKQRLSKILWEGKGIAPNSDSLNQALNVIEAKAVHDGECLILSNRVAEYGGNFFYDLCEGRAVRISKLGWGVTDNFPILFKRYSHQQKQVEPKKGGNIQNLFRFINVREGRHQLLSLVYSISCLVPNIPHPIFHPYGDQGAGKTSLFTFNKLLLDPSKLDVIITPRNLEELAQTLEHHYLCMFDNLSSCPDWLSDLLSQACTGGGFSKRKLYTDDEDIIYRIQRCIGLNGINLIVSRGDLMDRTILLHMDRIEPSDRKEKKVLMQEFEEERPYILGRFFDVLSKAMSIYPTVKLSNLPRMADFMTWGVAISQALGYKADDFIEVYQSNIESQSAEIINSNTLAQAVLTFMQERESWRGTVKQAYEELEKLITVSKDDKSFPKCSNKLRKHLNRVKPNLLDHGIKFMIADYDSEHKGCPISFQKVAKGCSLSSGIPQSNKIKGSGGGDQTSIHEYPESILTPATLDFIGLRDTRG